MHNNPVRTKKLAKLLGLLGVYLLIINISSLIIAPVAQAQGNGTQPPDFGLYDTANLAGLPNSKPNPTTVAAFLINSFLSVVGVIAVVVIIYGGFLWMTSAGNEEKITKAKSLLTNAVIGLFIILASYVLTSFIIGNLKKATIAPTAAPATPQTCAELTGTCVPAATGCTAPATQVATPTSDCLGPVMICCK